MATVYDISKKKAIILLITLDTKTIGVYIIYIRDAESI